MANPIVTTITPLEYITNNNAKFEGNTQNNGWETLEWGFWWYKDSEGIGTKAYIASTTTPLGEGDFEKMKSGLIPYTLYKYQARCYYRKWNVGLEDWDYIEIFGNWEEVTTDAKAIVKTIIATNATKDASNNSVKFIGYIDDDAGGNVITRGFKYGLTEEDTWDRSENAGGEGRYNLIETGLPGDTNFCVRAYVVTPTGTYYDEDQYVEFSTKVFEPTIFFLIHDWYDYTFFMMAYGHQGNIYNAWELTGTYWDPNCICVDEDGNTYTIKDSTNQIIKRNKNGVFVKAEPCTGDGYSIAMCPDGNICVRGRNVAIQYLKRYDTDLNAIGSSETLYGSSLSHAYTGLAIDDDKHYYTINLITNKIERWEWTFEVLIQDDEFQPSAVHIDTDIIDLEEIDIPTGAMIRFWKTTSLPSPLVEETIYWAIRTSEKHIKVATSYANAMAGIPINITDQGVGTHYIEQGESWDNWEKTAEYDLAGYYADYNFIAIAGNLIYSTEYGEDGWTIPLDLSEEPTNWIPSNNDYVKSLSSLGRQIFLVTGLNAAGKHIIAFYNSSKEFLREAKVSIEVDLYSLTGINELEVTLINKKAVKNAGHLYLYGEITDKKTTIVERGFEYKVQDEEPGINDTGTEVKETGADFGIGEYHLSSWDTFNDLYRAEKDKIWWFRAYCLDEQETKYTAETWMKNVPTMTTFECTEVFAQEAKGNGELVDLGGNIVTKRGFRIIKEYSGDLHGAATYRADGFEGTLEIESVHNENGILIGFRWTGELYRDSLHEDVGGYELGIYDKILGGGFTGEGFGLYLKSNDKLKVVAIAENQLGMGFGEEVDLNTGKLILPSDDEIVSDTSAEKTITLGTLPGGTTVTRIGIRLGRTMGCNEIHVYEDGEWGSGQGVTFFITDFIPGASYYKMPYIVIDYGDYEEEVLAIPDFRNPERLEEWLEDYPIEVFPEVEDEDELDQIIIDSSVGDISYRTIIKEIKCERIGDQSFIDRYGRRRSQTVDNHLIQSRANCKIIVDDYIDKFQILKQQMALEYDIPIPFEREDVILLGDGKTKYKSDGQGLIAFKADGEGEILQEDFILAKIRKMDGRFISGKEAILNLELEV